MKSSYYQLIATIITFTLLTVSCAEEEEKSPTQIEKEQVKEVENLLVANQWAFNELKVSVKHEARANALLVNVADENGMVQPGIYNSNEIFGNDNRQLNYVYDFAEDNTISLDTSNADDFQKIGQYSVLNLEDIRINFDSVNIIRFGYEYNAISNKFIYTSTGIYNERAVEALNSRIYDAVLAGKPNDVADKFVAFLEDNENVNTIIKEFLYDLIHGKIEAITESPEDAAEMLAGVVLNKLQEVDWEALLYDKILELLQKLQVDNPEETASEIAMRISDKIEASITQSDIYELLLPILQDFEDENLPVLSSRIAALVYDKIAEVLSEENIYNKVYPVWDELTNADTNTIIEVADTIASFITAHFFDYEELTQKLIPFIAKVDETNTIHLGRLADEIITDVLMPVVDTINATFPGVEIEPEWETIKPYITSVLTGIKAALNTSTIEELSETMANALIKVMDLAIQKGFEKAIYTLQTIPADQVASIVASWGTNWVEMAEQPVIDFIEEKLNAIFDKFDADKVSEELSALIHEKIQEVFSEENLYEITLPILENLQQADMEKVAQIMAEWLVDSDIISDNISEEELIKRLTQILTQLIGNIDADNAVTKLVELIQESGIAEGIDGTLLTKFIEMRIYDLIYAVSRDINAIEHIEITLLRQ